MSWLYKAFFNIRKFLKHLYFEFKFYIERRRYLKRLEEYPEYKALSAEAKIGSAAEIKKLQKHHPWTKLPPIEVFCKEQETKQTIRGHLRDRVIAKTSAFKRVMEKTAGVSEGYIAIEASPNAPLFMMKKFETPDFVFINEYVTAPFYIRFLHDRAPIVGIATDAEAKTEKKGYIYLRSKFLLKFTTLSKFTASEISNRLGPITEEIKDKLKKIDGIEKVFAAMLALGETDMNPGNLGVIEENGKLVLAKIDHGGSATMFFTNPHVALELLADKYNFFNYQNVLPLNVNKLKEALIETASISDEEIDKLVGSRIDKLKKLGLKPENIEFIFSVRSTEKIDWKAFCAEHHEEKFMSFAALEKHYTLSFQNQVTCMKEVIKRLDIISKLDFSIEKGYVPEVVNQWENGGWLQKVKGTDPISFAKSNNLTIDGMNPDEWKKLDDEREGFLDEEHFGKLLLTFVPRNKQLGIDAIKKFCEYILLHRHTLLRSSPKIIDEVIRLRHIMSGAQEFLEASWFKELPERLEKLKHKEWALQPAPPTFKID